MRRILFVVTAIFWVAGCSTEPGGKPKIHSYSSSKQQHSFIAAITLGNIGDIKKHLAEGSDPNISAPLHVAIESQSRGRMEMVALLWLEVQTQIGQMTVDGPQQNHSKE